MKLYTFLILCSFLGIGCQTINQTNNKINRGSLVFTLAIKSNRNFEQAIIPVEIQAAADEVLATFKLLGVRE